MEIKEVQLAVDEWIGQFKEGYWPPLANLARLVEEVGELSREINHRYGPKTKKPEEDDGNLAMELGDILFVIAALANSLQIDLESAFQAVLTKYRQRDSTRWERHGQTD